MLHTLYLVATVASGFAGLNAPGSTSYTPVLLNLPYSQCQEQAYRYQRENGDRGSFVCVPSGVSVIGYPVASR